MAKTTSSDKKTTKDVKVDVLSTTPASVEKTQSVESKPKKVKNVADVPVPSDTKPKKVKKAEASVTLESDVASKPKKVKKVSETVSDPVSSTSKPKRTKKTSGSDSDVSPTNKPRVKRAKTARAPTAYNIFMKEQISKITGVDQKEKLKTVAGLWKTLTDTEKEPFTQKAEVLKVAFLQTQSENPQTKSPSVAKRSPNAYNLFIKERMATATGENQTSKLKSIALEWKGLDESKKQTFRKDALQRKEQQALLATA